MKPGGKTGPSKAGVMRCGGGDAEASFNVSRQGDLQIVRIGNVEVYRIPDAFVVGG